jgi:dGTPase
VVVSRSFSRLRDKSQMLLAEPAPGTEHGYFRLEHALEVTRVARTIARGLRLNEDLVEAIALGHDLGATSFGEAGERALSMLITREFRHNDHGLRVVERLEGGGAGLNLTFEVRDGILNHVADAPRPATLEGQTVRVADEIVTVLTDLHAARTLNVLVAGQTDRELRALGGRYGQQVATIVADVIATSLDRPEVAISEALDGVLRALRGALAEVSARPAARAEVDRAVHCLCSVAVFYLENAERLPESTHSGGERAETRVVDYVAGLTDTQARSEFTRLFVPGGPHLRPTS